MLRPTLVAAVILVISFADINAETANSPTTGDNPSDTNVIHPPEELPPHISSFLPNPNGPFYGFPFDTKTTWSRMLPFTVSGHCEAGKIYTIKKPEDVLEHHSDLECLYNTGIAPSKVPEGPLYGTVISTINTRVFNQFMGQVWKGKTINRTECNGNTAFVGWNNLLNNPNAPFLAHIGHHSLSLAPGEYDNGRPSVVLEYGVDVTQLCPEYKAFLLQNFGRSVLRGASWSSTSYPLNQIVESFRFVGKQDDGADIYLGKMYMKDPYRDDHQAVTVAYSLLVSFDKEANPLSISGLPSLPSGQGFKYMLPGILDLMFRLNPVDNLVSAPIRTFTKIVRGALRTGTNSFLFAQSLPFGLRHLRQNSMMFKKKFNQGGNDHGMRQPVNKRPQQNLARDELQFPTQFVAPIVENPSQKMQTKPAARNNLPDNNIAVTVKN